MPIETEVVAQDAMSRIIQRRLVFPFSDEDARNFLPEGPTAEVSLRSLMDGIRDWMLKRSLPDPGSLVVCREGFWCAAPSGVDAIKSEAYFISKLGCRNIHFSRGWEFIERCNDPLSAEAGYARLHFECWRAMNALKEGNIQSLYHSAIKIGSMGTELSMRAAFLSIIEKKKSEVEKNRSNGAKGGQANKRQERYSVLNSLAGRDIKKFQYVNDRQARRTARQLAAKYDASIGAPLFQQGGKPLSDGWYDGWLEQFREAIRKATDK